MASKCAARERNEGDESPYQLIQARSDNVINPNDLTTYEDQLNFLAAGSAEVDTYGEMKDPAVNWKKTLIGITFQATGVAKGWLNVEKMYENGHAVVFDGDMSLVVNKTTDEVNHLRREDGNFVLDLWIPPRGVAEGKGFGREP